MPLIGAEVLRVRQALTNVTAELEAVLLAMQGAGAGDLGTTTGEAAISAGLTDLVTVAALLRDQSQECVKVTDRRLAPTPEGTAP